MCLDITKYEIYLNAPDARAYRKICLDGTPPCRQEGGRPTFPELTVSVDNARVAGPRFRECNRQGGQQDGRHSERLVKAPPICAGRGLGQRRSVLILPHCLAGARQWVDDRVGSADLVVNDAPPHAETEARIAVRAARLVVVPVQPSPLDLWATAETLKMAQDERRRPLVVLNRVPPRSRLTEDIAVDLTSAVAAMMSSFGPMVLGLIGEGPCQL